MFFHVNTRKGCVILTNSSVKHSFKGNPQCQTSINILNYHQLIVIIYCDNTVYLISIQSW